MTAPDPTAIETPTSGAQATGPVLPVTVIRPTKGWRSVSFRELWAYRELVYFLAWRDVKVRYKQTVLGAAWAVLQPFATMVLMAIVFRKLARIETGDVPYALFAFCGLIPWQYFANSMNHAGTSLLDNRHILTKVYFPRIIFPLSGILPGLLDLAICLAVLGGFLVYYGRMPGPQMLLVPVFILVATLTALAIGVWWSALTVRFRDVKYTMPLITQLWMLATPVAYPRAMIPKDYRWIYDLNPMAGVVEGFRWAVIGGPMPRGALVVSTAAMLVLLVTGLYYFARTDRTMADHI